MNIPINEVLSIADAIASATWGVKLNTSHTVAVWKEDLEALPMVSVDKGDVRINLYRSNDKVWVGVRQAGNKGNPYTYFVIPIED